MNKPDFLIIPYQIAFDKEVQPNDKLLFGILYWLTHLQGHKVKIQNQLLAKLSFSEEGAISNSLSRLEEKKYIVRKFNDKNEREIIVNVSFKGSLNSEGGVHQIVKGASLNSEPLPIIEKNINTYKGNVSAEKAEELALKLIDFYKDNIGEVKTPVKLKHRLKELMEAFTAKELAMAIDNKAKDDWFMKHNAKRGPIWFFKDAGRITRYIDED